MKNGKNIPKFRRKGRKSRFEIDIEKYIQDYEKGLITKEEIGKIENMHKSTIHRLISDYYYEKNNNKNHEVESDEHIKKILKDFLKKGMSEEQIKEIAAKRNIRIPDKCFEEIYKEINNFEIDIEK